MKEQDVIDVINFLIKFGLEDIGILQNKDIIAEEFLSQERQVKNDLLHNVVGSYFPTQRDYFIAKAMQGILSGRAECEDPTDRAIKHAVETADEILKQL